MPGQTEPAPWAVRNLQIHIAVVYAVCPGGHPGISGGSPRCPADGCPAGPAIAVPPHVTAILRKLLASSSQHRISFREPAGGGHSGRTLATVRSLNLRESRKRLTQNTYIRVDAHGDKSQGASDSLSPGSPGNRAAAFWRCMDMAHTRWRQSRRRGLPSAPGVVRRLGGWRGTR